MLRPTILCAALALAPGCAELRVQTQLAPEADLRQYKSFAWLPPDTKGPETIVDQQVRAALRKQLEAKGFREADPDSADFLIGYHVLQERKLGVADWGNGIYGWTPDVVAYSDGSLILDFVDPKTNRIFWRGSAAGAIETPGVIDIRRLDRAATAMIRRYPYASSSSIASVK